MNRTLMNREARQKIAEISDEKNLIRCELCGGTFGLAPAHKYSRVHYRTAAELADYNSWLCLCQPCHSRMDDRSQTTSEEKDEIFNRLRPQ